MRLSVTVNGASVERDVEPRTLLVDFIRDELGLTGTNIGCDTSQCGACTIQLDGAAVKSCTLLAVQAEGSSITTIEGLAPAGGELHPVQRAFHEEHGLQCGFCTPGMVMTAVALLEQNPDPTDAEIRSGLDGICYRSKYGYDIRNWALFEPFKLYPRRAAPIDVADPELVRALAIHRLQIGSGRGTDFFYGRV